MQSFDFLEPEWLSDELKMVREQLRRYVAEEILPHADAWEQAGQVPR